MERLIIGKRGMLLDDAARNKSWSYISKYIYRYEYSAVDCILHNIIILLLLKRKILHTSLVNVVRLIGYFKFMLVRYLNLILVTSPSL